ncbi:MAG TPA: pyridoxal-dependent decarboxylase [Pyrinomonadaceae bacterium]|nr:pyridoxal-dependent decarboxylase [Pyrinomonadaceae bacterium]
MNINDLRSQSALDLPQEQLDEISLQVTHLVSDYFTGIRDRSVRPDNHAGKTLKAIDNKLDRQPVPLATLMNECQAMFDLSRHNGHPRFFGYVASPSTPIGAYADLVASTLNANITCWRSGPAGTEVERLVVRWLGQLISYDDDASGLLTSGGSMANMIALLIAARRTLGPDVRTKGLWQSGSPLTIYASNEAHLSVAKAADILGFGRDSIRTVACDQRHRLIPAHLRQLIQEDLKNGFRPSCVVGSAGTVNTGVVDPLHEVAEIAHEFEMWFHVDGAYGAPGVMDPEKKKLFHGLAQADSVSLDPHKWLYVPVDVGCLLFRDSETAASTFRTDEADYIKLHGHQDDEAFAFWDYGIELSRRFRALKVWFTLRYYGAERIAQSIAEDNALAQYLAFLVDEAEDLELLAPVELSICCFRYLPYKILAQWNGASPGDRQMLDRALNDFNERLMSRVQTSGRAYLSNAMIDGRFALRACITNFRTTKQDIDDTVNVVRDLALELQGTLFF